MSKCPFCHRDNPASADRCQNCGSWIEQAIPTSLDRQESRTDAQRPAPGRPDAPDGLESRILSLMQSGRKIEAIKLYREQTGKGLKEAKDAVEAFSAGQPLLGGSPNALGLPTESLEGRILALVLAQRKIEAIKLYREQTDLGLKEAKDAVEALAAKHGIKPQQSGCATMLLLIACIFAIIGLWSVLR